MMEYRGTTIKFPEDIFQLLKKVAKARRERVSDFVRRAVIKELAELQYLSDEEKKALGMRSS